MAGQVSTLSLNDLYSTLVNSLLSLSHLAAFLKGLNFLKQSCLSHRIDERPSWIGIKHDKILQHLFGGGGREKSHALLGSLVSKPQNYARFARSLTLFTVSVGVVFLLFSSQRDSF